MSTMEHPLRATQVQADDPVCQQEPETRGPIRKLATTRVGPGVSPFRGVSVKVPQDEHLPGEGTA